MFALANFRGTSADGFPILKEWVAVRLPDGTPNYDGSWPMAEVEAGEMVILTDENGDYFVLAKEVIERGKLEGDLKDAVVDAAESDVSGFSFNWGGTQFQPVALSGHTGPAVGSPYAVVGSFRYEGQVGVNISATLLPGR